MGNLMKLIVPIMIGLFCFVSCADDATENEERYFTVTFNSMGGSEVKEQKVKAGEHVVKPENPTKDGVVFLGWFKSENFESEWVFDVDVVDSDITLYAKWLVETETCMISFNTNGGNDIETVSVEKGNTITGLPTPEKDGFVFDGWFTDDACTNSFDESMVITSDMTLYAKWKSEVDDTVKKQLEDLINKANGLNKEDYSETSFERLEKYIEFANVIIEDANSTQEDMKKAYDLLDEAIKALFPVLPNEGKPYEVKSVEYEFLQDGKRYILINGNGGYHWGISFNVYDVYGNYVDEEINKVKLSYDASKLIEWTADGIINEYEGQIDFKLKPNLTVGDELEITATSISESNVSTKLILKVVDGIETTKSFLDVADEVISTTITFDNYFELKQKSELAMAMASCLLVEGYDTTIIEEPYNKLRTYMDDWWNFSFIKVKDNFYFSQNMLYSYTQDGGNFPAGELISDIYLEYDDIYSQEKAVLTSNELYAYTREFSGSAIGVDWKLETKAEYKFIPGENGGGTMILHYLDIDSVTRGKLKSRVMSR